MNALNLQIKFIIFKKIIRFYFKRGIKKYLCILQNNVVELINGTSV